MMTTYKAKLKGNQLEWADEVPPPPPQPDAEVLVTFLATNGSALMDKAERGARMKAALDQLAARGGMTLHWQIYTMDKNLKHKSGFQGRESKRRKNLEKASSDPKQKLNIVAVSHCVNHRHSWNQYYLNP